jgi:hypothetical protein
VPINKNNTRSIKINWKGNVMDAADEAQLLAEQVEELKRKHQRNPVMDAEPTGYCLNCGNPNIVAGMRWCPGTECRDDWQLRNRV